jgi:hypothetical protein
MPDRIVSPQLTLDEANLIREGLSLLQARLQAPEGEAPENERAHATRLGKYRQVLRLREEQF